MAQMAQQEPLYIEVSAPGTFTDAQKAKLIKCYKAKTILDVVQRAATGVSRCIAAFYADESTTRTRTYTFVFGGATLQTVTARDYSSSLKE